MNFQSFQRVEYGQRLLDCGLSENGVADSLQIGLARSQHLKKAPIVHLELSPSDNSLTEWIPLYFQFLENYSQITLFHHNELAISSQLIGENFIKTSHHVARTSVSVKDTPSSQMTILLPANFFLSSALILLGHSRDKKSFQGHRGNHARLVDPCLTFHEHSQSLFPSHDSRLFFVTCLASFERELTPALMGFHFHCEMAEQNEQKAKRNVNASGTSLGNGEFAWTRSLDMARNVRT